jgi:hypothetical protein
VRLGSKTALAAKKITACDTGSNWRCGRPRKVNAEIEKTAHELRKQGMSVRKIARQLGLSHMAVFRLIKQK